MVEARRLTEGELVVYSELDTGASSNPDENPHHSGYRIYSQDGKPLKHVSNWVSAFSEYPAVVALAPGRYGVVTRATAAGIVKVPVIIEAGKTTSVHLDGSKPATTPGQGLASDFVRLPNGFVVGWSAHTP